MTMKRWQGVTALGNVAVLPVDEAVRVNAQRLGDIVNELGEQAAGSVLTAALEQLATGLTDARAAALAGDVGTCAERRDEIGLGATLARMMRVGSRSLTEIWDGQDVAR